MSSQRRRQWTNIHVSCLLHGLVLSGRVVHTQNWEWTLSVWNEKHETSVCLNTAPLSQYPATHVEPMTARGCREIFYGKISSSRTRWPACWEKRSAKVSARHRDAVRICYTRATVRGYSPLGMPASRHVRMSVEIPTETERTERPDSCRAGIQKQAYVSRTPLNAKRK